MSALFFSLSTTPSCCSSVSLLHVCGFVLLTSYARICTDIHLASALVNSISLNQGRSYPLLFQSGLHRRSQYSPMPPCTSHWSVRYLLNYLFWLVKGIKCVCITIIIAFHPGIAWDWLVAEHIYIPHHHCQEYMGDLCCEQKDLWSDHNPNLVAKLRKLFIPNIKQAEKSQEWSCVVQTASGPWPHTFQQ